MKTALLALALSWPLIAPALDTLPTGCTVTRTFEDASALADCGAYTIRYDADGQPYPNSGGQAVTDPGWFVVEEVN